MYLSRTVQLSLTQLFPGARVFSGDEAAAIYSGGEPRTGRSVWRHAQQSPQSFERPGSCETRGLLVAQADAGGEGGYKEGDSGIKNVQWDFCH